MTPSHSLRPLLMPASVALVGASSRPGSMGRVVLENLLAGDFHGGLFAVNPRHRRVLARRSYASLSAIEIPVDLAVIAVPSAAVAGVLDDGARAGIKAAIVLSPPPAEAEDASRWRGELLAAAKSHRIRIIGPHAFGVIRTDIGLNATLGTTAPRRGRLALIAQSGAVCAAMLDFADSVGIGFSTVVALGSDLDIGFGELLDALLGDPETDGILVYAEQVGDARRFLSALRAAARTKPVVVLKAGRSMEHAVAGAPSPDAVFDAAMWRTGSIRVKTYAQLFAAARILAMRRIAHGDRIAIVANGHGPGTLAADIAADRGIALAEFAPKTQAALARVLPPNCASRNPVNVRGDASAKQMANVIETVLADRGVDAVVALHVTRPGIGATDAARAIAEVGARTTKPVLAGWLGSINRREVDAALEAGGVADFFTPEHAVEAFSFLSAYRRNQEWLLEVPSPQPEPRAPDPGQVARIRTDAATANRTVLTVMETHSVLATFGLPVASASSADTLNEALAAARRLGYPVSLRSNEVAGESRVAHAANSVLLRDGRMLTRAWSALLGGTARTRRRAAVVVRSERPFDMCFEVAVGVRVDAVFGPVITLGPGRGIGAPLGGEEIVLLPPLNERLAADIVRVHRATAPLAGICDSAEVMEGLTRVLVQVSALVCALPWLRSLALDPVRVGARRVDIAGALMEIDTRSEAPARPYGHMAIHPYPIEQVADVTLRDGVRLHVRPIRPEDAEMERAFVGGLSEETRYFRFFYQLHALTPAMLARFTQIDYDREMALVAVDEAGAAPAIVGVARYITMTDPERAEFAVVIADAWQGRGTAHMLMTRLIDCARQRGLKVLDGTVLRANSRMLKFTERLGFATRDDPDDPDQVIVTLDLA